MHGEQLTDAFQVKIGVKQSRLLSPFLFILVIDWIVKTTTSEGKYGIQWRALMQLDDLDLSDDLVLQTHTHKQMQIKITSVAAACTSVGLNIYKGKSKILQYNTENTNPVILVGETLEEVESFTYLNSVIDQQEGSDADVKARNGKESNALLQL
ncbi:unnamed protein product [Schistosoma curassoni]|uniref:Reverse transcriptase domain-containing protein n=1 Tax=Schistosoma curassoni TaxID=6186 RepID=A0A183K8D3_9TREM|nr:unnamed protein product [Schistosoma curassoni]